MIGLFDFPYAPTSEETVRWLAADKCKKIGKTYTTLKIWVIIVAPLPPMF